MDSPDDELGALIGSLDPTRTDAPPARGSTRHHSILETAMSTHSTDSHTTDRHTTDRHTTDRHAAEPDPSGDGSVPLDPHRHDPRRSGPGRWLLGVAAAALVLGAVGGAVLLRSGDDSTPADTTSARPTTVHEEIVSLRGEVTTTPNDGSGTSRSTLRVHGNDRETTSTRTYPDGHTESATRILIGGTEYETIEGVTTRRAVPVEEPAPFSMSSAMVLKTLRGNSTVVESREVDWDGGTATRLELEPTAQLAPALSTLPAGVLAWFELEYPAEVESVTLWVTDQVIRQIEVTTAQLITRSTFSDFNADIEITPPPGPYVDATD